MHAALCNNFYKRAFTTKLKPTQYLLPPSSDQGFVYKPMNVRKSKKKICNRTIKGCLLPGSRLVSAIIDKRTRLEIHGQFHQFLDATQTNHRSTVLTSVRTRVSTGFLTRKSKKSVQFHIIKQIRHTSTRDVGTLPTPSVGRLVRVPSRLVDNCSVFNFC